MNDLRQTDDYAQYLKKQNWQVEKLDGVYAFIRKIPLTPFSIIKIQRPQKTPLEKIQKLAKQYHALATYIEPLSNYQADEVKKAGFRLAKSPFLPSKTLEIDLTQSEEKILQQMKKDARYAIRKTKKSSLQLIEVVDFEKFRQVWRKSIGWQRWAPSLKSLKNLKKALAKNAIFLAATVNSQIIAGTVILLVQKRAYYYYAFSSKTGRKNLAQYFLVWQAIKLAQKRSCQVFDFEGIYDERFSNKSWLGFTHFKKSFGGREISYPGCFVKSKFNLRI